MSRKAGLQANVEFADRICPSIFSVFIFFQAEINNEFNCLSVGQEYEFEASATSGTDINVTWHFEQGVSITDKFLGEFSSAKRSYR